MKKKLLFSKKNYLILFVSILFISTGFFLMSGGESKDPIIFWYIKTTNFEIDTNYGIKVIRFNPKYTKKQTIDVQFQTSKTATCNFNLKKHILLLY